MKSKTSEWAVVLSSLTDNKIQQPKEMGPYLKSLFNNDKSVFGLIQMLVIGWNSLLAETAQKTGHYSSDLVSVASEEKNSPLNPYKSDKEWKKHMDLIGKAEHAVKCQVTKSGKNFLLSFPILANIDVVKGQEYNAANLSPGHVSGKAKLFPTSGSPTEPILSHSPSEAEYKKYFDFLKRLIPDSAWQEFVDPNQGVNFFIPFPVAKQSIGFVPEREQQIPQSTLLYASKWVKGFTLVGPPLETDFSWIEDPIERVVKIAQARLVHVFGTIELPNEFAKFITQSEEPKGGDIFVWLMAWMKHWVGSSSPYHVEAVRPLSSIKKESAGHTVKGRANADGLMISPEGYIYYIPTVDNVEDYEKQYEDFVNHDGVYTLVHVGGKKPDKLLPANMVVYTDWLNNKLAYSDSIGMLQILDLDGFQPVNPTQARNLLDLPVLYSQSRTKVKYLLGNLSYTINHYSPIARERIPDRTLEWLKLLNIPAHGVLPPYQNGNVEVYCNKIGIFASAISEQLKSSPNYISEKGRDLFDQYGPGLKDLGLHDLMTFPLFSWVRDALDAVYQRFHGEGKTEADHIKFIEQRSPLNGMQELGLLIAMVRYGSEGAYENVVKQDKQRRAQYTDAKIQGYDYKPKAIAFTEEDRAMLPHQVRVDGTLDVNMPEWSILAIDAGGGKTLLALRQVVRLLMSNKIKRPLISMPGFLLKNYIEENVYFYGGKYNMVVLNSNTMGSYGEDGLFKLVQSAPPNTIFLSDFAFLSNPHRNREVYYGSGSITTNLNVEFLLRCGIDFFAVDESHGLRNDKASKTIAARKLALGIKYKMIMTGTFIHNNLSDTAGQYAIFDPSLFGNKSDFVDEFGDVVHGNKVISWKKDAEAQIKKRIGQQCMLIEAKRKEWGAALPHLVENLYVIDEKDVDPEWYTVYKALLEQTIEQIKQNKTLAKQMEEDDVDELDLAAALNPYLARLEAFMTAPNADPLAAKILKGKQLVGPKVKAAIEIIEEHIKEGMPGKILIVANQHVEADAVYENFPPQLRSRFIRYHAENKDRDLAKFKRDPNIIGLIGVEDSLGTGLNLQHASHSIRLDGRWNPGDLEQFIARTWRPNPKEPEATRAKEVVIDTLVIDHCLVGETLIPTSQGLQRLGNLGNPEGPRRQELSIKIISKNNATTTRSWWNQGIADTLMITLKDGHKIQGTKNHKILVLRDAKHIWVDLSNAKKGDLVCVNTKKLTRKIPLKLELSLPPYESNRTNVECKERLYSYLKDKRRQFFSSLELDEVFGEYYDGSTQNLVNLLEKKGIIRCLTGKRRLGTKFRTFEIIKRNFELDELLGNVNRLTKIPKIMTPDLAYCLGLFIAEGGGHTNIIYLAMQNKEPVQFFAKTMETIFGVTFKYLECPLDPNRPKVKGQVVYEDTLYKVKSHCRQLIQTFSDLGLHMEGEINGKKPSWNKVIPWSILEADEESQKAFLAGFWEGDGTQSAGELAFCSYSQEIKDGLQAILGSHGIHSVQKASLVVRIAQAKQCWELFKPYIKGPKVFRPRLRGVEKIKDANSWGIPLTIGFTDWLVDRFIERTAVQENGALKYTYWYKGEEGDLVGILGSAHQYAKSANSDQLTTFMKYKKVFQYESYDRGAYTAFLDAMVKVVPTQYKELESAIRNRYYYEPIIAINKGGKREVYDLSISNGKDGKDPSYVANGIISHNTIDVTKFARLVSKILSKTKFDEVGNPKYDKLETLPIIKMNLDTIMNMNSVDKHLAAYADEYKKFKAIYNADMDEWKERFKDTFKMKDIPAGAPLKDSKMMRTFPYILEMHLPNTEKLGLVRYSDYVDAHAPSGMEDPVRQLDTEGKWVHTEFGDGKIVGTSPDRVKVKLVDGTLIKGLRKIKTFVMPEGAPKVPVKERLAKTLDLPMTGKETFIRPEKFVSKRSGKEEQIEETPVVNKEKIKKSVEPKVEPVKKNKELHRVTMAVEAIYDQLALSVPLEGLDEDIKDKLETAGYRDSGPYIFAKFTTRQQLNRWVEAAQEHYFIHQRFLRRFKDAQKYFNQGPNKAFNASSAVNNMYMANFWRMKSNKAAKDEIRPYVAALDHEFHVVLSLSSLQPANRKVPRDIRVPGVKWIATDGEMIKFFSGKKQIIEGIQKLAALGIVPDDMDEVKQSIKDVRMHAPSKT